MLNRITNHFKRRIIRLLVIFSLSVALDPTMLILSDLYRVAIHTGERVLSPGIKKVFHFIPCDTH